jgi:E3 ubiquitin-protein ligase TRIP12
VVDIALGEASAPTPTPTPEHPVAAATPSPTATTSPTHTAAARTELLRSKAAVVGRFMMLSVPVLVDVYAASVIASVRIKALTGVLKAVAFLDDEGLRGVLYRVPMAGFASSILSSRDHPSLVLGVMQLVEMLLAKLPGDYRPAFRREGVVHELESFAGRQLVSAKGKEKEKDKGKDKDQDKDKEGEPAQGKDTSSPTPELVSSPPPPVQHIMSAALAATVPGYKKLSTMALDPEDAITLRAKVIQFKYLSEDGGAGADGGLEVLQRVGKVLAKLEASEDELHAALGELTTVFRAGEAAVSSFELLQSGVVNALMTMATSKEHVVPLKRRQQVLFEAFSEKVETHGGGNGKEEETALSVLVKKLQESLTRMESYDVVTVSPGLEGRL